jgi:HicB family
MPSSLHDALAIQAEADGISLNQFICCVLAGSVDWRMSGIEQEADLEQRVARLQQLKQEVIWEAWLERSRWR